MSVGSRRVSVQSRLVLTRQRILAFRRRVGGLDVRMPEGSAWATRSDTPRRRVRSPSAGTVRVRRGSGRSSPTRSPRQGMPRARAAPPPHPWADHSRPVRPLGGDLEALGGQGIRLARRIAGSSQIATRRRVAACRRRADHARPGDGSRARTPATEWRCLLPARRSRAGALVPAADLRQRLWTARGRARCRSTARSAEPGDDRATPCGSTPGHACRPERATRSRAPALPGLDRSIDVVWEA